MDNSHKLLTQHKSLHENQFSNVLQAYKKLNQNIDNMQDQVQNVIDKHQSQFMVAYRMHIEKVKKQLGEIKKKSEDQEKMFSANDRIKFLQKQIAIFRQQSIKLYDKLQKITFQLQTYKRKQQQLTKQLKISEQRNKQLIKQKKNQNATTSMYDGMLKQLKQQIKEKQNVINKYKQRLQSRNTAININNRKHVSKSFESSQKVADFITNIQQNSNINSMFGSTLRKSVKMSENSYLQENSFKQLFMSCVRSIKKQIALRKQHQKPINLKNISNLSQFRQLDKKKVIQLFFTNQKMQFWLYQQLFPNNLLQKLETTNVSNIWQQKLQSTSVRFQLPKVKLQRLQRTRYNSVLEKSR